MKFVYSQTNVGYDAIPTKLLQHEVQIQSKGNQKLILQYLPLTWLLLQGPRVGGKEGSLPQNQAVGCNSQKV